MATGNFPKAAFHQAGEEQLPGCCAPGLASLDVIYPDDILIRELIDIFMK
jgi:hypothetical protein